MLCMCSHHHPFCTAAINLLINKYNQHKMFHYRLIYPVQSLVRVRNSSPTAHTKRQHFSAFPLMPNKRFDEMNVDQKNISRCVCLLSLRMLMCALVSMSARVSVCICACCLFFLLYKFSIQGRLEKRDNGLGPGWTDDECVHFMTTKA